MNSTILNKPKIDISAVSNFIAKTQKPSGEIPWHKNGKTDPWDHIESAMGLMIGGHTKKATKAFFWLKNLQRKDGSWFSSYKNGISENTTRETNMSAYIAVGVLHYWLITHDRNFLKKMWKIVQNAINFVIKYQGPYGQIYWAISPQGKIDTKALLTGSCSIFMSIKCAIAIAYELGITVPHWKTALKKLGTAIKYNNFLFDNSKSRFSMDWFYPILCGAISGNKAIHRINKHWNKFVIKNVGVKCVHDKPWITIAESSELILSLQAMGNIKLANTIFSWIYNRIFEDKSYWCGFTFPNMKLWPKEKITWTNAVILMATDSLYNLTPASKLFNHKWWKINKYIN